MFTLARFGYFEPIRIELFGKRWSFEPKATITDGYANSTRAVFEARQTAFAGTVAIILTINTPHVSVSQYNSLGTFSSATRVELDL